MICIILADFFHKFFLRKKENEDGTIEYEEVEASASRQVEIAEYSIFTVVSFLSNLMQKVEWQTYENGEEIKSAEHYLLNVRPNPNQSASDFWYELFERRLFSEKNGMVPIGIILTMGAAHTMRETESNRTAMKI